MGSLAVPLLLVSASEIHWQEMGDFTEPVLPQFPPHGITSSWLQPWTTILLPGSLLTLASGNQHLVFFFQSDRNVQCSMVSSPYVLCSLPCFPLFCPHVSFIVPFQDSPWLIHFLGTSCFLSAPWLTVWRKKKNVGAGMRQSRMQVMALPRRGKQIKCQVEKVEHLWYLFKFQFLLYKNVDTNKFYLIGAQSASAAPGRITYL